ncbi:MAG: hypothetical protein NT166_28150 [Candidatus Aminicenantes bacterium]|nr:hypothetical protein [Candidatus Aminicenantes bacterium]
MNNVIRPKVKKITVELDNGAIKEYPDVQGNMPIGLFWEDLSVIRILAEYYGDGAGHDIPYEILSAYFGEAGARAVGAQPGQPITVTRDVIAKLWNTPGDDGNLPALITKIQRTYIAA